MVNLHYAEQSKEIAGGISSFYFHTMFCILKARVNDDTRLIVRLSCSKEESCWLPLTQQKASHQFVSSTQSVSCFLFLSRGTPNLIKAYSGASVFQFQVEVVPRPPKITIRPPGMAWQRLESHRDVRRRFISFWLKLSRVSPNHGATFWDGVPAIGVGSQLSASVFKLITEFPWTPNHNTAFRRGPTLNVGF